MSPSTGGTVGTTFYSDRDDLVYVCVCVSVYLVFQWREDCFPLPTPTDP